MKKTALLIAMGFIVGGCWSVGPATAFAAGNAANGKKLYENKDLKCAKCHGDDGEGDGRKGRKLDPRPTDFTDPQTWTRSKKMPNLDPIARMKKAIKEGGPAVKESKGMDANKDLTSQQIDDLVEYIKTFKNK